MIKVKQVNTIQINDNHIAVFRITNTTGAYIEVMNYGATITSVCVPNKYGTLDNVVLGYEDYASYLSDSYYMGATIGRVANRISNARFALDGTLYKLDSNDGANTNHGGFNGLNKSFFNYSCNETGVTFYTISGDMSGGFPGNLSLSVTYSFGDNNELRIEYKAIADKRTPINFTNHSYFNLGGIPNGLDHLLQVNSAYFLESDNRFLPTGEILNVENTAFNFSEFKKIGDQAQLKNDNLKGYNTYFIKDELSEHSNCPLASLYNPHSGHMLELYSSMPGFMFYTGDYLDNPFCPFQGVCLEAQHFPDFVNQLHFPSNTINKDEESNDFVIFKFSLK